MGLVLACCSSVRSEDAAYLAIRQEVQKGSLDTALRDVDTAIQKYGRNSVDATWRFRVEKANILFHRGSYEDALKLLQETLPGSLAHSEVAVRREMIRGLIHAFSQQFDLADEDLTNAEGLAHSYQPGLLPDVSQARGNLELGRKRYAAADVAFRNAASLARERNLPYLELAALANLGNVAMWQEHYDEAIDRYKAALQRAQAIGAASTVAKTLGNMGWNYSAIGDFENAEDSFKAAERTSSQAGLEGDRVYWLIALANNVYYPQHRYEQASAIAQQALSFARAQDDKGTLTQCLNTLSELALASDQINVAEDYNREAAAIENAGLDHFGVMYSQVVAGRIAAAKGSYPEAETLFKKVIDEAKADTSLRWEAQARLAETYAIEKQPVKAESKFRQAIQTIQNARDSLQRDEFRMSFLSTAIEFYDSYVNFLVEQRRPLDALKIADLSRAQTLEEGLPLDTQGQASQGALPNPQAIARRLNATLLFYWLGEQRCYLWAITPAKTSLITLPRSAEIDAAVKSYRQSFLDPRDPLEAGNADGKKLYATLIQPVEKIIPKNSRVVILPDGSLNSLNFETVIVSGSKHEDKPHYWIEDVTITTANSLALLSRSSVSGPPNPGRLLVVGDALAASPDFPPLPQVGKEVGLLENYFSSSQRLELTGADATATHFLTSEPEKFSYLHFATHGTASRTRPLESAVILSPEGDSFKLYARDVVKHPLKAYLVTISACNGAGTKSYAGEGLVGLSWAFLRAGAHNVIAGLWEVSNASTPQLMDELYKGLHAGEDPATALRKAKLTLVRSTGNYRKPFYWAPFLLYSGA
jgi:CHAT domain-containing protein